MTEKKKMERLLERICSPLIRPTASGNRSLVQVLIRTSDGRLINLRNPELLAVGPTRSRGQFSLEIGFDGADEE